ncbi:MAG: M56 family metallopeptidase [Pseudoclavibacter sp.]
MALIAWFGALFLGLALVIAALLTTLFGAVVVAPGEPARASLALTIVAWLGLGGFGAIIAFVSMTAEPLNFSHRDQIVALGPIALSREERSAFTLVRFEYDEAVAFAVPGRHPEILVSTACEGLLTRPQLQALLAHELAHLRQWHGLAVRVAEINAACLSWLPAGRSLRRATLLLVELAADDAAARQAGPAHLANALAALGEATGNPGCELRAIRLTAKRWPTRRRRRLPSAVRVGTGGNQAITT